MEKKTKVDVKTTPAKHQQLMKADGSMVTKITSEGKVKKTQTKWKEGGKEITETKETGEVPVRTTTLSGDFNSLSNDKIEWLAEFTGVPVETLRNHNNT